MVKSDRMPHAQLFLGAAGSGKLTLALAFAQYALCEDKQANDSCGECNSCRKVEKHIHPDMHFSFPTVGSKVTCDSFLPDWRTALDDNPYMSINEWLEVIGAENKQGNINKDECSNIIRKMSLKAYEGTYKVLIMWLPEYLGKEGNRLLKLIEEPPENTLFILVAEESEKILNTILSRCQIIKIRQLTDEEIINTLVNQEGLAQSEAEAIAHLADGNYNEARQLKAHKESQNAKLFLEWMRTCYQGNSVKMVKLTEALAALGREKQKYFLQYALHFMREYMILKMTGKTNIRLQNDELQTAQNLTKVIEFHQIEGITELFNNCSYYIERNANPKILFLDASIQINKILKNSVLV